MPNLFIRLSDEEMAKLRDMASRDGFRPSTYAAAIIRRALNAEGDKGKRGKNQ